MTVTITITDPTATEATALRAYLTALHGGTAESGNFAASLVRTLDATVENETDEPDQTIGEALEIAHDRAVSAEDAGAPDFDSAGMPWDERIHASSRATVADGTWRKKRGVSDELVAEVEAEIAPITEEELVRQDQINSGKAAMTVEVPEAPVPEPVASGVTEPTPPAPTTTEDAPPPPPAPTANPFLALMSRIGKSKLDKAKKDELLTAAGALDEKGAPSLLELNKRPELIDGFIALLDSEGV